MKIWGLQQISNEEKENILSLHKEIYNGYQTLQPKVSNEQPLYVQDFAKDKTGAVINNKGFVKGYTNVGINEQVESKEVCDECGSMMMEGECMECGWKGEVGAMEEEDCLDCDDSMKEGECSECGGVMMEGECSECGYKMEQTNESYKTGKLSDIYKVEDLGNSDFDYVEGGGNDYGTFEKMHHMKGIKNENIDGFEMGVDDPDNEDDGFEDIQAGEELGEQGGNADDMDVSDVEPAYDFVSDGPMDGGDVYPVNEDGECEECWEKMESAWADEELDENDISGVQGIYGDMEPAFDFDSEGPGSAGPYQTRADYSTDDDSEGELELDLDKFDPRDKSWEEITAYTGDDEFSHLDEDLQEAFMIQKNKIHEMFNRMKVIK